MTTCLRADDINCGIVIDDGLRPTVFSSR